MGNNIGTQAAALIEDVHEITWAMDNLGKIASCMTSNVEAEAYLNIVEFLAKIQTKRVDDLTHYIAKEVLPLVADIEEGGQE